MAKRHLSAKQFDPKAAVNAFPSTSLWDMAVQSAMENAHDQGLREDADDDGHAFWTEVHGEVSNRDDLR